MGQRDPKGTKGSLFMGQRDPYLWDKGILFMGQRDPSSGTKGKTFDDFS